MLHFSPIPLRPLRGERKPSPIWVALLAGAFICSAGGAVLISMLSVNDPAFFTNWSIGVALTLAGLAQLIPANILYAARNR